MRSSERLLMGGVLALLFIALACGSVWAQAISTAQISGTVKDQSGAILPGVEVTAIQTEIGLRRSVPTNENGSYVLTSLPIGPYRFEGSARFRTYGRAELSCGKQQSCSQRRT
jgi:hypothetical protein